MLNHPLSKLAFVQTFYITALAVSCLIAVPAWAGPGDELFNLTATDAAADDQFGWSVGISGNTAIVGAQADDDAGDRSGSAYLFDVTTGQQLRKLTASDAAADAVFGRSVAISGNVAIVGAQRHANTAGAAYLFDVTTGQELFKLTASDAAFGRHFGLSVAISENLAVVGAPLGGAGSAYVFDVTTGQELAKLTPSAGSPSGQFGLSVAISGNMALVGAPYEASGAAYLFDAMSGQQIERLTTSDDGAFGQSVAISGNIALVGRSLSHQCCGYLGAAYLIDVSTGQELFKLTGSDPGGFLDQFGWSVALSANTAIVGESTQNNGAGVAHLYDVATGKKLTTLTASDAGVSRFGSAVAIDGNRAIVGTSTEAAYVFSTIPEPASLALLALGLPLLIWRRSSRRSRARVNN